MGLVGLLGDPWSGWELSKRFLLIIYHQWVDEKEGFWGLEWWAKSPLVTRWEEAKWGQWIVSLPEKGSQEECPVLRLPRQNGARDKRPKGLPA